MEEMEEIVIEQGGKVKLCLLKMKGVKKKVNFGRILK